MIEGGLIDFVKSDKCNHRKCSYLMKQTDFYNHGHDLITVIGLLMVMI